MPANREHRYSQCKLGCEPARSRSTFAGTPVTREFCGTSAVTTAPAAMTEPLPTVTPSSIVACVAI